MQISLVPSLCAQRTTSMIVRPAISLVGSALSSNSSRAYELDPQSKFSYSKARACKVGLSSPRLQRRATRSLDIHRDADLSFGMPSQKPQRLAVTPSEPQRLSVDFAVTMGAMQASLL